MFRFCYILFFFLFGCNYLFAQNDTSYYSNSNLFTLNFFEANKYFLANDFNNAEIYYLKCLDYDPNSAVVYNKLSTIYLYRKDLDIAERYADKCLQLCDTNKWYKYSSSIIYRSCGKTEKAINVYKSLIKTYPKQSEFYNDLANSYIEINNLKSALNTYSKIESLFGVDELTTLNKVKIYIARNDKKNAIKQYKLLIITYPNEISYKHLLAEFYLQCHDLDEAASCYKEILEIENSGYAHLGLATCFYYQSDIPNYVSELKLFFKSLDVLPEVKVGIMNDFMEQIKDSKLMFDYGLDLSETLLSVYPSNADCNLIYSVFQINLGHLDIARKAIIISLSERKDIFKAWENLLFIDNHLSDWSSLYSHSSEAIQYYPNNPDFYYLNGLSAYLLSHYDNAIKSFDFGIKLISKLDDNYVHFLSILGECYYKIDNKSQAFKYFDEALVVDPNNLTTLNNYAYYLSLDKVNLDKAISMSKITIETEKNNSTYLDTYAWILFVRKEYTNALKYIELANKYMTQPNADVIEHYGDILYANDRIDEAIQQWQKALFFGEGSGRLNEKIENKQYIE